MRTLVQVHRSAAVPTHERARSPPPSVSACVLSPCRCEVRISQRPFSGTRMYMACYIPEPIMCGAYCQCVVFVLREKLSPRALWRTKRQYTFVQCDIKASIVALGDTIGSLLVKQKRQRASKQPRNMTNKTDSHRYLQLSEWRDAPWAGRVAPRWTGFLSRVVTGASAGDTAPAFRRTPGGCRGPCGARGSQECLRTATGLRNTSPCRSV